MKKVGEAPKLLAVIEDVKEYLKVFIIASILLFVMLAFTTQDSTGLIATIIFSILFGFILTLAIYFYNRITEN